MPAGAEGRKRGKGRVLRSFAIDANVSKLAGTLSPSCTPRVNRWNSGRLALSVGARACVREYVPATHTVPIYKGTWLHTVAGATRRARVVVAPSRSPLPPEHAWLEYSVGEGRDDMLMRPRTAQTQLIAEMSP